MTIPKQHSDETVGLPTRASSKTCPAFSGRPNDRLSPTDSGLNAHSDGYPRGAARLSPGDERNTAITFDILQSAAPILPVRLIYIRVFLEVVLLNGKENELWQFP